MMKLIDKDALKKDVLDLPNCYNGFSDTFDKACIIGLIDEQPTIEVPKWIPCSERLPEADGGTYLVTDYCEQINRRRVHVSYCYVNREGFWSDVPLGYKVIAWMPIEPRRGEQDG